MKTFEYLVKPKAPVRGLKEDVGVVLRPKILKLDKDDVKTCLKYGSVYRRFSQDELVKVTTANLDEVHVPRKVFTGEVPRIQIHPINDTSLVSNANTKEEVPEKKAEEPVKEEVAPVVEEKKEEPKMFGFGQPISAEEKVEESVEEEVSEPEIVEDPIVSEPVEVAEEEEKVVEDDNQENLIEETDEDSEEAVEENSEEKDKQPSGYGHRKKKRH